jgi:hypothetical protein
MPGGDLSGGCRNALSVYKTDLSRIGQKLAAVLPREFQVHDQWLCVDGKTANALALFDFTPIKAIHDALDAAARRKRQYDMWPERLADDLRLRRDFKAYAYAIGTALNMLKVRYLHACTTLELRPFPDMGSPVEWRDWTTPQELNLAGGSESTSFAAVLESIKEDH